MSTKKKWVCTGVVVLNNNTLGQKVQPIDEDGTLGEERYFKKGKALKYISVGAVFETEVTREGDNIQIGDCRMIHVWPDAAQRSQWQEEARAIEVRLRAEKRTKNDLQERPLLEAMVPIRKLYERSDYLTQLAIEVQVLSYLRRRVR